jgi:GH24 family phage-related lysozyme (muramidase)
VELIKKFEGCVLNWYDDGGGNWTIGYGYMNNDKVLPFGYTSPLTQESAETLLISTLPKYEQIVKKRFAYSGVVLNQNQFDALVSFAYNIGSIGNLLFTAIVRGDSSDKLKDVFTQYSHMGGKVIQGLINRRLKEWELFIMPEDVKLTKEDAKAIVKQGAGLTDESVQYIADFYKFGDELIIKLATAIKRGGK